MTAAINGLGEDRRLARSKVAVHQGGIGEAAAFLAEHDTPQLLIVEATETGEDLFQALDELAEVCSPGDKVVLFGQENDISLYRQLMEMGLSEYFHGVVTTEEIITVIEGIFAEPGSEIQGRVIAFIGVRGGVGSSAVAVNTAYSLAQQFKEEVILLDLDLCFGSATMTLDLQQKQNIADALAQPGRLDDQLMEKFMLKYGDYLSLVPAPTVLGGNYEIDVESFEVLLKLARQMASFVVLDVPHQWLPWVPEVLLEANEIVVTAYPDLVCLRDTKNIFAAVTPNRGVDAPTRLIFNRVGASKKTELSAKDYQEAVEIAPTVSIPFDPTLFGTAMNNGEMLAETAKGSKAVQQINALASIVSAREAVATAKAKAKKKTKSETKSLFSFLGSSK